MSVIYNITTEKQFTRLISKTNVVNVLNFWAKRAPPCSQMNQVFSELAAKFPCLTYIQIEAEAFSSILESMDMNSVPSFLIVREKQTLDSVEGPKPEELSLLVEKYSNLEQQQQKNNRDNQLRDLIHSDHVMVFMKGTPDKPRCGFSRQVIELLSELKVKYNWFDILTDNQVRQGLKAYSDWPTYPQIYIKGELIGGLDLLKEMIASGEFQKMV